MAITRAQVDVKHQDWKDNCEAWSNTSIMYEGEPLIKKTATRFLVQRPKEDAGLYAHRINLFTYENHLGTGIGYYEAQMFDEDPEVVISPKDKVTGQPVPDGTISATQDAFYHQCFLRNCDGAGTALVDKYQMAYQHCMLYGASWILADLPKKDPALTTLQQQQAAKALDPFIVLYTPLDVINWATDERGNLLWAVVYVRKMETPFLGKPEYVDRWYHFDRTLYTIYEQRYSADSSESTITQLQEKTPVIQVDQGPHAMAKYNRVPLQKVVFPVSWWLAKRAYSPAKAHICATNERRWSLHMAALAIPILFTDKEVSTLSFSEAGFLVLGPDDSFAFTEPNGKSWEELAKEKNELKEEIFRAMYLVAMARSTSATASAQSGVSKQQDMAPNNAVLSGMGAVLRSAMQETVTNIALVRAALPGMEDDANLTVDIRGFDFEDKLQVAEIDTIQAMLDIQIPSDLFDKELFAAAVRAFIKNGNPDLLAKIVEEIKNAPTRAEKTQADMQQRADMLRKNIATRIKDPVLAETGN